MRNCLRFSACLYFLVPFALVLSAQTVRGDEPSDVPEVQFDAPAKEDAPANFYAAGKLQRVRRKDNGSERLALTDSDGKIVAFLAPTARVDFRQHLGGEVAVKARILNSDDDGSPYVAVDSITKIGGAIASTKSQSSAIGSGVRRASYDEGEAIPNDAVVTYDGPSAGAPGSRKWTVQPTSGGESVPSGAIVSGPMMSGPGNGEYIQEGGMNGEPWQEAMPTSGDVCSQCGGCGEISGGSPCPTCQPPICNACGPPGWLWIRGEYLNWWADGMDIPSLLITSTAAAAGDVGGPTDATARVLYGNQKILDGGRSGFRLSFGGWFGPQKHFGYEGEFLEAGNLTEQFTASSNANGSPILARPFFNINPRDNTGAFDPPATLDSELVSFPNIVAGTFTVSSFSRLRAAAGRLRFNICCKQCPTCSPCDPCGGCGVCGNCCGNGGYGGSGHGCGYPPYIKVDFTGGYRYAELREGLSINEDLQSRIDPERIQLNDTFLTRNSFNGGEVGTIVEMGRNRWTLDMLMRLALGGVRQQVDISGQTTLTTFGAPAETLTGGLLAQTTNIGTYTRNDFAVVPELGTNLGFYLTPRLRALVGYTFFYFSNVVRPGDQIDLDVNPDFIPPQIANPVGLNRPEFVFRETNYWAQGVNVGLDFRW